MNGRGIEWLAAAAVALTLVAFTTGLAMLVGLAVALWRAVL